MAPDTVKGIQHVAVKKEDLIAALKKNREQHKKDYDEGLEGYRRALVLELAAMLGAAKEDKDVNHTIDLERPQEHLEEYDQLLLMLDMSVDTTVLLTQTEFRQYVMDKWSWKERFTTSTEAYKMARGQR
jgi:hypothetical protein